MALTVKLNNDSKLHATQNHALDLPFSENIANRIFGDTSYFRSFRSILYPNIDCLQQTVSFAGAIMQSMDRSCSNTLYDVMLARHLTFGDSIQNGTKAHK
jgi:hypothetical protein